MNANLVLQLLWRLVGVWDTAATHPALPGVVVLGTADVEWLEGEQFLVHRARSDHPDFPDSISIIGFTDRGRADSNPNPDSSAEDFQPLQMHYYDSRGVFRIYESSIDDESWRFFRDDSGFSQRFNGTFADGGDTIVGISQVSRDERSWTNDLEITYRRQLQRLAPRS